MKDNKKGILYIIPTPIGNIKDMTIRAIEVLKQVDLVLVESIRKSMIILNHFEIKTKRIVHNIKNEHSVLSKILSELKLGKRVALTTDSGTPSISDPGFLLIRECIKNKIPLECLPGATAVIPALLLSGLPTNKFVFEGFLPKKGKHKALQYLSQELRTIIIYESPHRILKTLDNISSYFGKDRNISVSREISKMYEQTIRGNIEYVKQHFEKNTVKGEFIITIEGKKT